jgi:hypothetical protein
MRKKNPDRLKIIVIAVLTVVITIFHFGIRQNYHYGHIVLRELYFLPILFGAFWFGIKGGLVTSIGISILYSPLAFMHWQNFAPESDAYKDLQHIIKNLQNIKQIVKKISFKDRFSLKSYVGETKIVDIESDRTGPERNIHV